MRSWHCCRDVPIAERMLQGAGEKVYDAVVLTRFYRFQNQLNSETLARRRRRRGNLVLNFVKFALLSAHFLQSPKAQGTAVDGFLTLAQAQFEGRIHGYEANR